MKCKWFNKKEELISQKIPIHSYNKKNKDDKFFNDINNFHYQSVEYQNNFKFNKIKIPDYQKKINKLNYDKNYALNKNDLTERKIKEINTKYNKKIFYVKKVTKTRIYRISPNKLQKNILFKWFNACDKVYNLSVDKFNQNNKTNLDYRRLKLEIFNEIYGNNKKDAPYDILTDEVRKLCSNAKSCFSNLKNGNIKYFQVKHINNMYGRSILIPKKSINEFGFFITKLGPMLGFSKINTNLIDSDCRLVYDKKFDKFYLKCPQSFDLKEYDNNREQIAAIDPGEKIFLSYYSMNSCGMIGDDIRKNILEHEKKIRIYQRNIKNNKNKKKKKLNNKKKLILKLRKEYKKIRDKVKELHNKSALFMVKNYKKILMPVFGVQNMVKKNKNNFKSKKELNKNNRLNKRVKFVLNMLSFYKFRQHLHNKGMEYGCEIKDVTEEETSQCCGRCGVLSNEYKNRIKDCRNCGLNIHRDINGSRNILIKNWKGNYKTR